MKANTIYNITDAAAFNRAILTLGLLIFSCVVSCSTLGPSKERRGGPNKPENLFNIPVQVIADDSIQSIQFHRLGNPSSAPIISLNSQDQLLFRFEDLSFESRQFRVSLTHHNPDWSRSSLPQERFMNGFFNLPLQSGELSKNNRPFYRQYSFEFPTEQFQITKSGNFLLKIEDADTGFLVLTLPFFVTENKGSVTSSVEEISVPRQDLRRIQRPVSRFTLPDIIEQPRFDLEFYFTQNQFWGRTKKADELDFSDPTHVQFEMSREDAFIGDYEFRVLTLSQLSQQDDDVFEAFPNEIPPRLILRDDADGFGSERLRGVLNIPSYGSPDMDLWAGYADVRFRFDTEFIPDSTESIHLLGDFNHWSVNRSNELFFNEETGRWETNQFIKKGEYKYKYVLMDGNRIDDLHFDERFTNNRQQYHAFVYMRDSQEFFYRLLQVQTFFSD